VIFDSAHNIEGVKSFLESFAEEAGNYNKRILIFGAMRDKAIKEMLQLLIPYFNEFYFTEIDLDRCAKVDELNKIALELNLKSFDELDVEYFISNFIAKKNNNCLVVLGSMYILGSIKEKLLYKN